MRGPGGIIRKPFRAPGTALRCGPGARRRLAAGPPQLAMAPEVVRAAAGLLSLGQAGP